MYELSLNALYGHSFEAQAISNDIFNIAIGMNAKSFSKASLDNVWFEKEEICKNFVVGIKGKGEQLFFPLRCTASHTCIMTYKQWQLLLSFFIFILWIQQMASSISGCDNYHVKGSVFFSGVVWVGRAGLVGGIIYKRDISHNQEVWDRYFGVIVWWLRDNLRLLCLVPIRVMISEIGIWCPEEK